MAKILVVDDRAINREGITTYEEIKRVIEQE